MSADVHPRRLRRIVTLCLLVSTLLVLFGPPGDGQHTAVNADSSVVSGLQVTLSATVEDAEPASSPALLFQIGLDNRTGGDLHGLRIASPIPAGAATAASWLGRPGQQPGEARGQAVVWAGLTLAAGSQLGPLAYRVLPTSDQDGATIFVHAAVQPAITWDGAPAGSAPSPVLPLNGLWGEHDLRRTVLPSGLTIFTQQRPDTPTVALRIAARAGSRDEDDASCGGSHWLEHAHFLGTATRPDNQAVGRAILSVGGQFNASTGWEATSYWDLVPAAKFDTAIDVLSDQILNSTFVPEAFEREKQVIIQEIKLRTDDPSVHAFDEFMDLAFQTSPLRRSPAATVCLLTLPVSSILTYRAVHYVTGNMAIAASGNLQHDDAVSKISRAFAGLPVGPHTVRPAIPEPIETQPRRFLAGDATGTSTIRFGWPAPGHGDLDWPAMVILSDILGSVGERMAETVRINHAVATGIDASYLDFSDAGALMLSVSAPAEQANNVVGLLLAQVQRLRDGDLSDADVQETVRATAGERAVDAELNLPQTNRATDEAAGALESYDEMLARIGAVTPADVQRVAGLYLDPSNYSLVILNQ